MNTVQSIRRGHRRHAPRPAIGALVLALALLVATAAPALARPFEQATLSQAARVVTQLTTRYSTIASLTDYTARTDPDQLLGLPGQYVARADFEDTNGVAGTVEVFATLS